MYFSSMLVWGRIWHTGSGRLHRGPALRPAPASKAFGEEEPGASRRRWSWSSLWWREPCRTHRDSCRVPMTLSEAPVTEEAGFRGHCFVSSGDSPSLLLTFPVCPPPGSRECCKRVSWAACDPWWPLPRRKQASPPTPSVDKAGPGAQSFPGSASTFEVFLSASASLL